MHLALIFFYRNINIAQTELKLTDNFNEMILDNEESKNEYADNSLGLKIELNMNNF